MLSGLPLQVSIMFFLTSDEVNMMKSLVLVSVLPLLYCRITLINVGNLSEESTGDNDSDADNNTIVVGVLLPKNINGNNDVVAKAVCQLHKLAKRIFN